jgi:hypothetical protein
MNSDVKLKEKLRSICIEEMTKATKSGVFDGVPARLKAFQEDPTWPHFGFDSPEFLQYQAVGNFYTAIFRKVGDLFEGVIQEVVHHKLGIPFEEQKHSFEIVVDGVVQNRSLDVAIDLKKISDKAKRAATESALLELTGDKKPASTVIEIRGCYMIGDSKRINADEHAAKAARDANLSPVMLVFCSTSLSSPTKRLRKTWNFYEGLEAYDFVEQVTGFDLQGFFSEISPDLQRVTKDLLSVFQTNR